MKSHNASDPGNQTDRRIVRGLFCITEGTTFTLANVVEVLSMEDQSAIENLAKQDIFAEYKPADGAQRRWSTRWLPRQFPDEEKWYQVMTQAVLRSIFEVLRPGFFDNHWKNKPPVHVKYPGMVRKETAKCDGTIGVLHVEDKKLASACVEHFCCKAGHELSWSVGDLSCTCGHTVKKKEAKKQNDQVDPEDNVANFGMAYRCTECKTSFCGDCSEWLNSTLSNKEHPSTGESIWQYHCRQHLAICYEASDLPVLLLFNCQYMQQFGVCHKRDGKLHVDMSEELRPTYKEVSKEEKEQPPYPELSRRWVDDESWCRMLLCFGGMARRVLQRTDADLEAAIHKSPIDDAASTGSVGSTSHSHSHSHHSRSSSQKESRPNQSGGPGTHGGAKHSLNATALEQQGKVDTLSRVISCLSGRIHDTQLRLHEYE